MFTFTRKAVIQALWLGLVYLVLSCAAIGLTRFHGGVALISVANAILLARLLTLRSRHWGPALLTCGVAGAVATATFGLGVAAALPMVAVNLGEVLLAAILLARLGSRSGRHASQTSLGWFLLVAGVLAPATSAFGGAALATAFGSDGYAGNWVNWFTGHALGAITFTPVAVYVLRGDARAWAAVSRHSVQVEAIGHVVLVAGVSAAVFAQETLPLLFVPMLPILFATFRIGRLAASAAVVILTIIGVASTVAGNGPISLADVTVGERIQFLQFYLACTVLMILPIAAELARRGALFRRLHDSEARYRLLTENSTDIILNLDIAGRIRFASPAIRQIGGYAPDDVIGRNAADLVDARDRSRVKTIYVEALRHPARTTTVEYRAHTAAGEVRWFESHSRAVVDEHGKVTGVVSAVRDVGHRKNIEGRLELAALTDKLTGIANRRAFDEQLKLAIEGVDIQGGGCVAIFDLDHFKDVNDVWGHAAGDKVLKRFAEIARGRMREQDVVARYGGEEFAVILPGASLEQARLVCDRLRAAVSESVTAVGDHELRITVSGGVAAYADGSTAAQTMAAADAALYQAKASGRDSLAISDHEYRLVA